MDFAPEICTLLEQILTDLANEVSVMLFASSLEPKPITAFRRIFVFRHQRLRKYLELALDVKYQSK